MGCSVKLIINCETNESSEIELTDAEIADREKAGKAAIAEALLVSKKSDQKNAILEKLGLTSDEAKLLFS